MMAPKSKKSDSHSWTEDPVIHIHVNVLPNAQMFWRIDLNFPWHVQQSIKCCSKEMYNNNDKQWK